MRERVFIFVAGLKFDLIWIMSALDCCLCKQKTISKHFPFLLKLNMSEINMLNTSHSNPSLQNQNQHLIKVQDYQFPIRNICFGRMLPSSLDLKNNRGINPTAAHNEAHSKVNTGHILSHSLQLFALSSSAPDVATAVLIPINSVKLKINTFEM